MGSGIANDSYRHISISVAGIKKMPLISNCMSVDSSPQTVRKRLTLIEVETISQEKVLYTAVL